MRYKITAFISSISRFVRMSSQNQVIRYYIRVRENVVTRLSYSISCLCSWECRYKIKLFSMMFVFVFVFVFVFLFKRMIHISFLISFNFWRCSCSSRARALLMRMFRYQLFLISQSLHRDRQWDEIKMSNVRRRNEIIIK
jgi:hypothetical protein